jgi:acyl-CoA thioesterase-1
MNDFLLQPGQTLVCLGDSITQNDMGYCAMLATLIAASYPERGIRVVNAGIGGHKAPDMLARLERDVLAHRPDWVTVNVGINDVWHGLEFGATGGVPLPVYRATLETLVDTLVRTGTQVVLVPPTVIGEDPDSPGNIALRGYRAAMREIGAARGLRIAPADLDMDAALASGVAGFGEPGKTLTTDGVHLRGPGDAVVAVAILKTLQFFNA